MLKLAAFTLTLFLLAGIAYAKDNKTKTEQVKKTEVVGNTICPIDGGKIDEKTKATYEYKDKIYNFKSLMCVEEFKKDPGKYTEKMGKTEGNKASDGHKKDHNQHGH